MALFLDDIDKGQAGKEQQHTHTECEKLQPGSLDAGRQQPERDWDQDEQGRPVPGVSDEARWGVYPTDIPRHVSRKCSHDRCDRNAKHRYADEHWNPGARVQTSGHFHVGGSVPPDLLVSYAARSEGIVSTGPVCCSR